MKKILFGVMAMGMLTGTSFIAKGAVDIAEVNVLIEAFVGTAVESSQLIITDTENGITQVSNVVLTHDFKSLTSGTTNAQSSQTKKLFAKRNGNNEILSTSLETLDTVTVTLNTSAQMSSQNGTTAKINHKVSLGIDGGTDFSETTQNPGTSETLTKTRKLLAVEKSIPIEIKSMVPESTITDAHLGQTFQETAKLMVVLSKAPQQ